MDRLPNDQFGTGEWVEAKVNDVRDTRNIVGVPDHIAKMIEDLVKACGEENIPVYVALSLSDKAHAFYDMGLKPEHCHLNFLLSRGALIGTPAYNQNLIMNPAVLAHTMRKG